MARTVASRSAATARAACGGARSRSRAGRRSGAARSPARREEGPEEQRERRLVREVQPQLRRFAREARPRTNPKSKARIGPRSTLSRAHVDPGVCPGGPPPGSKDRSQTDPTRGPNPDRPRRSFKRAAPPWPTRPNAAEVALGVPSIWSAPRSSPDLPAAGVGIVESILAPHTHGTRPSGALERDSSQCRRLMSGLTPELLRPCEAAKALSQPRESRSKTYMDLTGIGFIGLVSSHGSRHGTPRALLTQGWPTRPYIRCVPGQVSSTT